VTNTSPKLYVRPDRPVEPHLLDILRQVDIAAREHDIDYFVAGALARDLILLVSTLNPKGKVRSNQRVLSF
jgi:hypothetical protein